MHCILVRRLDASYDTAPREKVIDSQSNIFHMEKMGVGYISDIYKKSFFGIRDLVRSFFSPRPKYSIRGTGILGRI